MWPTAYPGPAVDVAARLKPCPLSKTKANAKKQIPFGNDNKKNKCNGKSKCDYKSEKQIPPLRCGMEMQKARCGDKYDYADYVVTAPSDALLTVLTYLAKTPRL